MERHHDVRSSLALALYIYDDSERDMRSNHISKIPRQRYLSLDLAASKLT